VQVENLRGAGCALLVVNISHKLNYVKGLGDSFHYPLNFFLPKTLFFHLFLNHFFK
jgi:hypothetical protein